MAVRLLSILIAVAASVGSAHADPLDDDDDDGQVHYLTLAGEAGIALVPPAIYYWRTPDHQSVDWTLHWDWDGWKGKLITFDRVKFDSNPFYVNAVRHPLTGFFDYQIARTNGVGVAGSTAFAFFTGAFWEYFVEYRENPSINDMILNTSGGIAIGEPMYQIAQVWRGGVLSTTDRLRTALFSPPDALHDLYRRGRWRRKPPPHSFEVYGGALHRSFSNREYSAVVVGGEAEVEPVTTKPGAASDVRGSLSLGDVGGGPQVLTAQFQSRTSLDGSISRGSVDRFSAIGTAFMYRRDRLAQEWDRLVAAHLLGGQLQLASHGSTRWRVDSAAYGDFALVQAHVFGPTPPFPPPPPYISPLQADGYYDAYGVSWMGRFRVETRELRFDAEASLHHWWQIDGANRDPTDATRASEATAPIPQTPTGAADSRAFGRVELDYRLDGWAVGVFAAGAYRNGTWKDQSRMTWDQQIGSVLMLDL